MKIKPGVVSLWLIAFLATLSPLHAAYNIILSDQEKERVDQGEIIVRDVSPPEKAGRTLEAVGLIYAPRNVVVQVLTDYENYPEFLSNVNRVDIVEQKDNESILNYKLTLPLGKIKKYRLKIALTKPSDQTSLLAWQLQEWPGLKPEETIKDTTGYWLIKQEAKGKLLVLYHVFTDPGPVPFGLGWIVDFVWHHGPGGGVHRPQPMDMVYRFSPCRVNCIACIPHRPERLQPVVGNLYLVGDCGVDRVARVKYSK